VLLRLDRCVSDRALSLLDDVIPSTRALSLERLVAFRRDAEVRLRSGPQERRRKDRAVPRH
jgi:hypothetical protein